jgi:TorA maturation chaperone TorD
VMKPSTALSLMGSMYSCKPSKEAVQKWKRVLADDTAIFMHDLRKAIDEIDATSGQEMERLLCEHTRLFAGPCRLACPPQASASTFARRLMMLAPAGEVRNIFGEGTLTIDSAATTPAIIGIELKWLAILLEKVGDEKEKKEQYRYIEIADKFIREHLMEWIPKFARDMEDAAVSPFYRELAKATGSFLSFLK